MYGCLVCIWRNYPAKIFCLTVSLPLYAVAGLGDAYPEKGRVLMCRIFFFFNALQLTVINLVLVLSLTAVDDVIFTMLHWSVSIATVSIGSTATLLGFAVTNLASSLLHPEALAVLRCSIYPCKLYPGTLLLLEEAHNLLDDSGIDEKMKSRTQYKYLESVTSPARRATSENDLQKAGETDLNVGQGLNLEEVLSRLKEMGQDLSALKEHYKVLTTFADHSGTADGVEIFFGFRKEELVEDLNFLARKILEILPSFRQQSSRSTAVIRVHFPWMAPRRMLTADTVWPTLSGAYLKVKFLRYGALIALWFFSAVSAFLVWSGLFEQWWLGVAVVGSLPEIMFLCSGFNRKMLTVLTTSFQTLFVWFHTCLLFFSFGVLWRGESLKLACLCLMLPSFLSSACMDALPEVGRVLASRVFFTFFLGILLAMWLGLVFGFFDVNDPPMDIGGPFPVFFGAIAGSAMADLVPFGLKNIVKSFAHPGCLVVAKCRILSLKLEPDILQVFFATYDLLLSEGCATNLTLRKQIRSASKTHPHDQGHSRKIFPRGAALRRGAFASHLDLCNVIP